MSLQYFDTHCHLSDSNQFPQLASDTRYLTVSTQPSDWSKLINIQNHQILCALGVHPWFLTDQSEDDLENLENLLQHNRVAAIGEIGLDFYPPFLAQQNQQCEIFEKQLQIAAKYQLPVSIHCRKAFDSVLNRLKIYDVKGLMHGFSGSFEQAKPFIKQGFKIGIGPGVLNPSAKKLTQLVMLTDLEHLVLETDYPHSKHGSGNYPLNIMDQLVERVAAIKQQTMEEVKVITTLNAKRILNDDNE